MYAEHWAQTTASWETPCTPVPHGAREQRGSHRYCDLLTRFLCCCGVNCFFLFSVQKTIRNLGRLLLSPRRQTGDRASDPTLRMVAWTLRGLRGSLLAPSFSSPPATLPPPFSTQSDGDTEAEFTRVRVIGKRLNKLTWEPSERKDHTVDVLVLGDSYADDIDMGSRCWPSRLAAMRGWSCLNVARGGARSSEGMEQYSRAAAFALKRGLHMDRETLCIVHLGGNDILHALWFLPLVLPFLFADILTLLGVRAGFVRPLAKLGAFSFFGALSRRTESNLSALLSKLRRAGAYSYLAFRSPLWSQQRAASLAFSSARGHGQEAGASLLTWLISWRGSVREVCLPPSWQSATKLPQTQRFN
jgi:hypothetical protein